MEWSVWKDYDLLIRESVGWSLGRLKGPLVRGNVARPGPSSRRALCGLASDTTAPTPR